MIREKQLAVIGALVLITLLMIVGQTIRPIALAPAIKWERVGSALACIGLMPPDCVDPVPGP